MVSIWFGEFFVIYRSFSAVGNYLGAVSAYTHALTLNSHMYEIYAGRAEAQLKLGNYNRAVIDSSKVCLQPGLGKWLGKWGV
jgi:tetratricopeptide (TPR) repeat protein